LSKGEQLSLAQYLALIGKLYNQKGSKMRKTVINQTPERTTPSDLNYLDLVHLAQVEISSESREHPIESALTEGSESGWQAASSGEQTIRLIFDQPQTIKHISLLFDEQERSRTQEFVLLWRMDNEGFFREILRQQYHFNPPLTTQEIENYTVDLNQLKALELRIIPDISGGKACAKLNRLRLSAM
jgi:hypothetical protein